jgi:hypothetical protein
MLTVANEGACFAPKSIVVVEYFPVRMPLRIVVPFAATRIRRLRLRWTSGKGRPLTSFSHGKRRKGK